MENATTVVDNPYGLQALWTQGDFVAKGTLIILVLMSLFSWYIILLKIWDQRKLQQSAKLAEQNATVGEDVEPEHAAVTPDSMIIESEAVAVEVEHALVIDGNVVTLSQAEVIALRDYLTELRTPALKAA